MASRGYSLVVVQGFLIAAASLTAEHGSRHTSFSHCSSVVAAPRPILSHGMWDLPGPGIEPVSPALAGRFLTTQPPGKSLVFLTRRINIVFLKKEERELMMDSG